MKSTTTLALLLSTAALPTALAKLYNKNGGITDFDSPSDCGYTSAIIAPGSTSHFRWSPTEKIQCYEANCGGGRSAPKYTIPGCWWYTGTETTVPRLGWPTPAPGAEPVEKPEVPEPTKTPAPKPEKPEEKEHNDDKHDDKHDDDKHDHDRDEDKPKPTEKEKPAAGAPDTTPAPTTTAAAAGKDDAPKPTKPAVGAKETDDDEDDEEEVETETKTKTETETLETGKPEPTGGPASNQTVDPDSAAVLGRGVSWMVLGSVAALVGVAGLL